MRLNVFLPHLAPGDSGAGLARAFLRRLGPTWEAAPLRRLAQALSLALFLVLFFYVAWPYGAKDYAALRESKEIVPAETFLALDPLVSLSTAVAARAWVWTLVWAAAVLAVSLAVPRGFCGYVCPLGTLADLFDWVLGRRAARLHLRRDGWWRHLRYFALVIAMAAAAMGVLVAGFAAAMPVLVRGMAFIGGPLQMGIAKGWYLVPPVGAGEIVSIVLFAAVLALGIFGPRFWCRCLCPSGAVFSAANLARLTERRVEPTCTSCGRCAAACVFGAIEPDFTTRASDCTFCQTCGGVCPVGAIEFVPRWRAQAGGPAAAPSPRPCAAVSTVTERGVAASPDARVSRRGFLGLLGVAVGGGAGGVAAVFGVRAASPALAAPPVRPPGSVPEPEFLRMCIRCGACFQACPNSVVQPMGLGGGLDRLWTPAVVANWSGCEPTCNNCGHVCPTGAIRALAMDEKRACRMGLAVVDKQTCLPFVGFEGTCRLCYDECRAAGYNAIEFMRINVETDTDGKPIEGTGTLVPVVIAEKCVGCGLCQTRCYKINVVTKRLLEDTAIRIEAGPGKEDRLMRGSYLALREAERRERQERQPAAPATYLPEFLR